MEIPVEIAIARMGATVSEKSLRTVARGKGVPAR